MSGMINGGKKVLTTQNRKQWNNNSGSIIEHLLSFDDGFPSYFSLLGFAAVYYFTFKVDFLKYKSLNEQTPPVPEHTAIIIIWQPESSMCTFIRLYFIVKYVNMILLFVFLSREQWKPLSADWPQAGYSVVNHDIDFLFGLMKQNISCTCIRIV